MEPDRIHAYERKAVALQVGTTLAEKSICGDNGGEGLRIVRLNFLWRTVVAKEFIGIGRGSVSLG